MVGLYMTFLLLICAPCGKGWLGLWADKGEISYHLFTKDHADQGIKIESDDPSHIAGDKTARTVFIIHGWLEDKDKQWCDGLKDAYLSKTDIRYQVVEVDWSAVAKQIYPLSKLNTKDIGKYIAYFILKLWVQYDVPLKNFEITGHSLGAHIAGFAGQIVTVMSDEKLRRITALDPAGPMFEWNMVPETGRLSKNDAEVVAVIHTDKSMFGYSGTCGSIEFFPNGGRSLQPGCFVWSDPSTYLYTVPCSHWRSYEYFEEALRYNKFVGIKCKNYASFKMGFCNWNRRVKLGGDILPHQTGSYYFDTNPNKPYAIETYLSVSNELM